MNELYTKKTKNEVHFRAALLNSKMETVAKPSTRIVYDAIPQNGINVENLISPSNDYFATMSLLNTNSASHNFFVVRPDFFSVMPFCGC